MNNALQTLKDTDFSEGVVTAFGTVNNWVFGFYALIPNLVVGVLLIFLFALVAYSTSRIIRIYFRRKDRIDLGNILGDLGFWGMMLLGTLIALTVIMPSLKPSNLLASLGIGSIAIGFAFKEILQNWFAGLLILLRMPFRRGDQIRVLDAEGTVMRIEPRATILRTYDGRDLVIPNTTIFSSIVLVHTSQPRRRMEIEFTVGYDYEVRRITSIISKALEQIDEILKDPAPQVMCWTLGATSLGFKLRWWIESDRSNEVISRARAVQAIKEAFEANDVDPTDPQLIYYQSSEKLPLKKKTAGKSAGKGKAAKGKKAVAAQPAIEPPPPPPDFTAGKSDPEMDKPKKDSKDKTLLS